MPSFLTGRVFKVILPARLYTVNYMQSKSVNCKKTLAKSTVMWYNVTMLMGESVLPVAGFKMKTARINA